MLASTSTVNNEVDTSRMAAGSTSVTRRAAGPLGQLPVEFPQQDLHIAAR
jgi:hypothetical protein